MAERPAVDDASGESIRRRIRSEYVEMPGLSLTPSEAQQLWGLSLEECAHHLEHLVMAGFLRRTDRGAFIRV